MTLSEARRVVADTAGTLLIGCGLTWPFVCWLYLFDPYPQSWPAVIAPTLVSLALGIALLPPRRWAVLWRKQKYFVVTVVLAVVLAASFCIGLAGPR